MFPGAATAKNMIYRVEVDLAIRRPPRADVTVYVLVEDDSALHAELTAIYMAMGFHPDCVMAVASRLEKA